MKISEGVEWAAHACALLAALPEGVALNATAVAAFHELPKAYMAKHLQALAKAGVVRSIRGAQGGYRLARPASEISLWDVRCAIEGPGPDFRCSEIRSKGPCATRTSPTRACAIARAFWDAERVFRDQLRTATIADIVITVAADYGPEGIDRVASWLRSVS